MAKKQEFKIPKDLGAVADLLYTTREARYALQHDVDKLEEQEKLLKDHLITNLPKSKAEGITGKVANATVQRKVRPSVEDWDALYKHVAKTKEWELLQRRLGEKAVQDRWDAGKTVPGVGKFDYVTVSLKKR